MTKFRILVIDDDESILEDYRKILVSDPSNNSLGQMEAELFGSSSVSPSVEPHYEVVTASQGQQGLEHCVRSHAMGTPFDLVIVDMRMPPGWDGLRTIQELWRVTPNVPTILCTAFSDYSYVELQRQLGRRSNFFILRKPFQPEELLQLVAAADVRALDAMPPEGLSRSDMLLALVNGEFSLVYQPIVWTHDQSLKGMEALLRWTRDGRTVFQPDFMIPFAEDNGVILEIGAWVAREAAKAAKIVQRQIGRNIRVTFNASAMQLDSSDFFGTMIQVLRETGTEPSQLGVELTETQAASRSDKVHAQLTQLVEAGYEVLIDDFGTGYSTLHSLATLPCTTLKLDGVFASALVTQALAPRVVEATLSMARSLGLATVIERIETGEQFEMVKAMGCDAVQGYYFAKPMPLRELVAWAKDDGRACAA